MAMMLNDARDYLAAFQFSQLFTEVQIFPINGICDYATNFI